MRNAAEMALAEFNDPNIQLLVKDDGGTAQAAQLAAQQSLDEGAQIILGPLFSQSVSFVGQVARSRNVPVIAFSTDTNVASNGVYLLSFLPESDVDRIVQYASSVGKRSFAALIPDNPYGTVVEAAFKQAIARRAAARSSRSSIIRTTRRRWRRRSAPSPKARSAPNACSFRTAAMRCRTWSKAGRRCRQSEAAAATRHRPVGRPAIFATPPLDGGWYAAPDATGYRNFATRYRARYNQDPVRTATLAYDAVALIAALVKTQGPQRFSPQVLTNPSGFTGIDGLFRFRADGTNERGLAVLRVTTSGPQTISPAPRSFSSSAAG